MSYTFEDISEILQSRTGVLTNSKFEFIEHGNTTMTMTKAFMNINRHMPDIMPEEHKPNNKLFFQIYGKPSPNTQRAQLIAEQEYQEKTYGMGGLKEMQTIRNARSRQAQQHAHTLLQEIQEEERTWDARPHQYATEQPEHYETIEGLDGQTYRVRTS